ncbi:MAG TPA: hypothetical protein VFU81_23030 [Thermomicrobiales bacterium]|nr:hypothetical protein [Thermomicrobiales bacterium]
MDPTRFDARSRALGRHQSRRTALAAFLAGPLALLAAGATEARHKKRKKNPCKGKPDDAPFKGTGRCLLGVCNSKPTCLPTGADCSTNPNSCCSTVCATAPNPTECEGGGGAGRPCLSGIDCFSKLQCLGYVCMTATCPANADFCADGSSTCGNGGLCLRPNDGGPVRCGASAGPATCGCKSHAECQTTLGAGAFCATISGANCSCGGGLTAFCAVPA